MFPSLNRIGNIPIDGAPTLLLPNLQYDSVNNKFIWVASSGGSMGDLEFIQTKVLSSEYFQVSGDIDTVASTIEYIVPSGKTAFLIEAKIVANSSSTSNKIQAALKVDTVVKDEAEIFRHFVQQMGSTNFGGSGAGLGEAANVFNVKGLSLVGDGAKKIEVENIQDGGGAFATMSGYLVDT